MFEDSFSILSYVRSFWTTSMAYSFCGRWDEAVEEGKHALNIAKKYSNDDLISYAAGPICTAYTFKGDISQAIEYGELSVKKAPTPFNKAMADAALAYAQFHSGDLHKGIETLDVYIQIGRAGHMQEQHMPLLC